MDDFESKDKIYNPKNTFLDDFITPEDEIRKRKQ